MRTIPAALLLSLLSGTATAQFASISQPPVPMSIMGRPMMGMGGNEMFEEGMDEDMPVMPMGRAEGDDLPPVFKSPLGKYLQRLDYNRSPELVLRARAKLATDAREQTLPKDAKEKKDAGETEAPVAEPEGGAPGPAAEPGAQPKRVRSVALPATTIIVPATPSVPTSGAVVIPSALATTSTSTPLSTPAPAPAAEPPPPTTPGEGDPAEGEEMAMPGMPPAMMNAMTGIRLGPDGKPMGPTRQPTKEEKAKADQFRLQFVAGDWAAVAAFLKSEAGEDAESLFTHLLNMLQRDSAIVPGEVLAFAECAPGSLSDKNTTKLAAVLKNCIRRGSDPGSVAAQITRGTTHLGGVTPEGRARAARFLMAADLPVEAQPFLDPLDQARAEKNAALINLHAMYFQGLAARKTDPLEKKAAVTRSFELCLEVMAIPLARTADRNAALERAITFMEELPPETVDVWLRGLFENSPDLAWNAIEKANQRARAARGQARAPEDRVKGLLVLKRIGQALLDGAGENAPVFRTALDMMSMTILEEAEDTKRRRQDERFRFIPAEQLGEALPSAPWLRAGDPGLAAKLELQAASVSGGAGDITGVIEMVRPLVTTDKERAGKIAEAVIAAWPGYVKPGQPGGDGYDPYMSRRYAYGGGGYYGGYGYGGYDGSIPLTRARQQRYLEQLGTLLAEFDTLALTRPPTPLVVAAFTASHADSEVYEREAIEAVFGPVARIQPEVATELADAMRKRLGGLWRRPQTQQENGAKRNDKQIAAEVSRGYTLASDLAQQAATTENASWRAATLIADLSFDRAEFLYGQKADLATYSTLRENAFAGYAGAAGLYAKALAEGKAQPTARVYFQWFSSSLGASDLGVLTRQETLSEGQVDRVLSALRELPPAEFKRHVGLFAKETANALNTLAPELKVRFLNNAGRIVGDHADGAALRKQLAYYTDLRKEVELTLSVDGPTAVGHTDPFGAVLSIWATRAVGRDSGGFSKYLMNQQWHPQTGQPVDYKDDLEKKLRSALAERFDVVAISFSKPGLAPAGLARPGWEQHPLAYLLLKARDAAVDKVPALQLDMDFSDGRGSVILPVTTQVTAIDARTEPPPAAVAALEVEQTLDARPPARQIEGAPPAPPLRLEVRAKAKGLVPPLAALLDLAAMKGFEVIKSTDNGTNITEVTTTEGIVAVSSDRSWTIELAPAPGRLPASFTFPTPRAKADKFTLKRYVDADILSCEPTVAVSIPSKTPWWQLAAAVGLGLVILGGVAAAFLRRRAPVEVRPPRFTVPPTVTPVNAIAVLRRIASVPEVSLPEGERVRLVTQIADLEREYFAPTTQHGNGTEGNGTPHSGDISGLVTMVEGWVAKAERALRN
ncbi:MAG: hypothetical protein ACT4PL_07680 [Phycisphaerales bacterium]